MLGVRLLVATGVGTVAVAALAWAATDRSTVRRVTPSTPFEAEGLLGASGNPEPSVDYYPDGAESAMHWSMCARPGVPACKPIPSKDGSADPGPEPAGTVFKVTAIYHGLVPVRARRASRQQHLGPRRVLIARGDPAVAHQRHGDPL